jgi:hypothetical protein
MRLLFGGLFDFKFGRRLVHLAFKLITGLLEFSQTLTESAGELGKLFRAEKQNHNHENKDRFRPAGHTECDGKIHLKQATTDFPPCKEISKIYGAANRQEMQLHVRSRKSCDRIGVINLDHRECVVVNADDLFAFKETGSFRGILRPHREIVSDRQHGKTQFELFGYELHVPCQSGVSRIIERLVGALDDESAGIAPIAAVRKLA